MHAGTIMMPLLLVLMAVVAAANATGNYVLKCTPTLRRNALTLPHPSICCQENTASRRTKVCAPKTAAPPLL